MRLYCLRHGESDYNLLGLCNDDPARPVHLTGSGREQARLTAERLRDVPLECIFVSELPRTQETAAILNTHHKVTIITEPLLNDIKTGFDGQPVQDYFAATGHDRLHLRVNGGESLLDYKARVYRFLDSLHNQDADVICLVVHEETMRVVTSYFRKLSDDRMEQLHFGNCEVVEFEL